MAAERCITFMILPDVYNKKASKIAESASNDGMASSLHSNTIHSRVVQIETSLAKRVYGQHIK